jgi:hydrogenase maturation factor
MAAPSKRNQTKKNKGQAKVNQKGSLRKKKMQGIFNERLRGGFYIWVLVHKTEGMFLVSGQLSHGQRERKE